jgi:hypothetical protein
MASLNISLPKTLRKFIETQVREGDYSTPSEHHTPCRKCDLDEQAQYLAGIVHGSRDLPRLKATPRRKP